MSTNPEPEHQKTPLIPSGAPAEGDRLGRGALAVHALVYLVFGVITIFVQTPDEFFAKILLGSWMLALGASHASAARSLTVHPIGAALNSVALVQAATGALLIIMPPSLTLMLVAVCAGAGLSGIIKLLLGMRSRAAALPWRDWMLEGAVLIAVAVLLPFIGEIGVKATLGVAGGGALIIGIFLLVGALGPAEKNEQTGSDAGAS